MQKLGGHCLFANQFELDGNGVLRGFKLRIRGRKERIVSGFKSADFSVAAMGDSLNDLSLLRSCDYPVLFRPVEALLREFPGAAVAVNFDEALDFLTRAWRKEQEKDRSNGAPA
jgi:phosphoserine phosphatase